MKGLLLKHGYVFWGNYKIYLVLTVMFTGMGWINEETLYASLIPCVLNSGVLTGILGNDERDRWGQYVRTMPCTPQQTVGSYYLFGLILAAGTAAACALGQAARLASMGRAMTELVSMAALFLPLSLLPPSLMLPLIFRFGTNKAMLAYYGVIGAGIGGVSLLSKASNGFQAPVDAAAAGLLALVTLVLYGISFAVSVPLYKSREV